MHVPSNRFGIHSIPCRFCEFHNTMCAGNNEPCRNCGKVLENRPAETTHDGTRIYIKKPRSTFVQLCDDNWITWADCRNTDGYVWLKGELDIGNTLAALGLPVKYSGYSPHFHGPAWLLAVDGPLDKLTFIFDD